MPPSGTRLVRCLIGEIDPCLTVGLLHLGSGLGLRVQFGMESQEMRVRGQRDWPSDLQCAASARSLYAHFRNARPETTQPCPLHMALIVISMETTTIQRSRFRVTIL